MAEARVSAQELGEEDKENNPSETAVLQQTVNRLNTDLHELRVLVSNKDAEIKKLSSECSQLQSQLQEVVSDSIQFVMPVISPEIRSSATDRQNIYLKNENLFYSNILQLNARNSNAIRYQNSREQT